MSGKLDHVKHGKHMCYFVYPPSKLPNKRGYKDGLKEICIEKIQQLLDRTDVLKEEALEHARTIRAKTKRGSFDEYFWKTFAACKFSEYYVIRKWLKYWTTLWRKVSDKPLPLREIDKLNHYGYFEVQQARHVPLEDLYEGKLKKMRSRLVGLCPFHNEKTPSFYIYPDNHFHCYGCNAHGDTIEFISKLKGLDFPEAVRSLL